MISNLTLDDVAAKFSKWRNSRINKRGRIPSELLALIPPLKQHYNISLIAKKLNLSGKHMKQIFNTAPTVNFIELPSPLALNMHNDSNITCELSRADGTTLKIVMLNTVLPELIKEFLCCN